MKLFVEWINIINAILSIFVYITILFTFIIKYKNIHYLLDEHIVKLYMNNYEIVKDILDKKIENSKVTEHDIDKLNIAERQASLYLNRRIELYIKHIKNILVDIFNIQNNCNLCNENLENKFIEISGIRRNLENFYRQFFVR